MIPSSKTIKFVQRLDQHPELRNRMESILNLSENVAGDVIKADDAEKQTVEAVRQLGSEILHDWANRRVDESVEQLRNEEDGIEGNGKKKSSGTRLLEK